MKPKMKTYTKEELHTILEKHKAWANGMPWYGRRKCDQLLRRCVS